MTLSFPPVMNGCSSNFSTLGRSLGSRLRHLYGCAYGCICTCMCACVCAYSTRAHHNMRMFVQRQKHVRHTVASLTTPQNPSPVVRMSYTHAHAHCLHMSYNMLITHPGGNILVDINGQCKLADFGASLSLAEMAKEKPTIQGTPYWMAPEVIKQGERG